MNPDFHKEKKYGRRSLSKKGKQALANVATFPFHYVAGVGLVPFEDALANVKHKKGNVVNKASKKGHGKMSKVSYTEESLVRIENTKKRAIVMSERERTEDMSAKELILERTKRAKVEPKSPQVSQTAAV